jgi:hypothetical protein
MRTPLIVVVALVRGLVVAVTLSVAAPARAEEMATFQTLRWRSPLGALLESQGNSAIAGERVTVDEAIALALNANRPAKNAARLQLVTESVIQAYAAVQRAQRALEIREEALRMSRELDRLMSSWPTEARRHQRSCCRLELVWRGRRLLFYGRERMSAPGPGSSIT